MTCPVRIGGPINLWRLPIPHIQAKSRLPIPHIYYHLIPRLDRPGFRQSARMWLPAGPSGVGREGPTKGPAGGARLNNNPSRQTTCLGWKASKLPLNRFQLTNSASLISLGLISGIEALSSKLSGEDSGDGFHFVYAPGEPNIRTSEQAVGFGTSGYPELGENVHQHPCHPGHMQ